MWIVFCCILLLATLFLAVKLFFTKKEIRSITQDIKTINPKNTNQQVSVHLQDKDIINLSIQINKLYQDIASEHKDNVIAMKQVQQNMQNISHDLRTPLTSIIGYLDLLAHSENITPEERQAYLNICQKKAASLQDLVQGLFELSRLENQEYPFELQRLNATNILQQALANTYDSFTQLKAAPAVSIPQKSLWIINDEKALARIFSNLINNIVKHGTGEHIAIIALEKETTNCFIFENEAPRLSAQDTQNIFARFFTSDKMRSKENTGIGLSIVNEFVKQTKGTIYAEKEGTLLRITLEWKKEN